ncbi:RNA-binding S4 domain-containing protein [Thiohalorhabdus sp.]|uniref:RNA-binding S4 domain-containing protein n=1 Tax=Thiohalorhabdus sp. TaxID=3094134 RepID=UPI002FC2C49A
MRLDLFLKITRLIKRRPLAKEAAEAGCITRNGQPAKAGDDIKAGDRLVVDLANRHVEVEVLAEPPKQLRKDDVDSYIRLLNAYNPNSENRQ